MALTPRQPQTRLQRRGQRPTTKLLQNPHQRRGEAGRGLAKADCLYINDSRAESQRALEMAMADEMSGTVECILATKSVQVQHS